MTSERFVVLGLAHVRSAWAVAVARWSTTGSLPVEFVKCVGADELRARIATGRVFSAALLDARLPAVDRDLLATLAEADIATIIVEAAGAGGGAGGRAVTGGRDWRGLGAAAIVGDDIDRARLLDALAEHGRAVDPVPADLDQADADATSSGGGGVGAPSWRGLLVAVTGCPGSGASTIAAALTQRAADDPRHAGDAVLVDLCRRAHQALLHDARDVVPGIQELVEAHRTGRPSIQQIRDLSFDVPIRRYRLVLGLRRPSDWVTIRPRAFAATLDGLRRSTRLLVADVDGDLDGEAETGSVDLEDRNLMARTAIADADVVVAVGTPTVTGLHGLVNLLEDLRTFGMPGNRTLVVLNRAPRNTRARAELTRVVAELTGSTTRGGSHVGPVYVPERRSVEAAHRDLGRFPAVIADPPGLAVLEVLNRLGSRVTGHDDAFDDAVEPVPIRPGELGHWSDDDDVPGLPDLPDLPDAEAGR